MKAKKDYYIEQQLRHIVNNKMIKILYSLLAIIGIFIVWVGIAIFPFFTVEKLPRNFPIVSNIPEDIDSYLQQKESEVSDIFPNAEKKIYWNNNTKDKTKYSIVFVHGFTTTGYQSKDFLNKLSRELKSNLYITRLSGHGVSYEGTKEMQIDKIMHDVSEAIIIGERIGENVVLIGHSLGGALSMLAANDELLSKKIDTLVLFAPGNSGLSPFAFMNTLISSFVDRTGSLCWLIDCDPRSFMELPEDEKWENYFATDFDTSIFYQIARIPFATDSISYDTISTSALVFYDENDQLVSSGKLKSNFNKWPAKKKVVSIKTSETDRGRHMFPSIANSHLDDFFVSEVVNWLESN